jgi:glycosyltransferase involved in cell wall biosynthesis
MVCSNEADRLPAALESVTWADEVVVLDLESTDGSAELARQAGAQVHSHPPHPIVEPLRDEVAALCSSEWVLVVDPDERVRPGLAQALRAAARRDDIDAVVIPRTNIDFGWPPSAPGQRYEPQLRFYRRSAVRWPHFPNRLPQVPEDRLLRLPPDDSLVLEHDRNRRVAETADRLVRYAPAQAQSMLDEGRVFTAQEMLRTLGVQFQRHVLDARAWEDGLPGLIRAGVLINHHFYVWVEFWRLSGAPRTEADDRAVQRLAVPLRALRGIRRARRALRSAAGRTARLRSTMR